MYQILWDAEALKELDKLEFLLGRRIASKVKELSVDPLKGDVIRLKGSSDFRLRVGDYRVIFSVEGDQIIILKVGHRKNIYDR
jgi:mRNA interferase RelE/StbE